MNNIPPALREDMAADRFYHHCARQELLHDHVCQGDPIRGRWGRMVEWEHALVVAGKQLQKRFAIVPLCWYAHRGPGQNKSISVWIALNRATLAELEALTALGGRDYLRWRDCFNMQFGVPALARLVECEGELAITY